MTPRSIERTCFDRHGGAATGSEEAAAGGHAGILPGRAVETSGSAGTLAPWPPRPPTRSDRARRAGPLAPRLEILKTLGDNTRYAIYLELARAPRPLATAEIAETLDLHPNTVRPHLERMRDLGLVEVTRCGHRRGGPAPAPLRASPTTPPASVSNRRCSRCSPACCSPAPRPAASTPTTSPRPARAGPCRRGTAPGWHCRVSTRSSASWPISASTPPGSTTATTSPSPSATAPSASSPRPTPTWCAASTGHGRGLRRRTLGGAEVVDFHPLVDRSPCQVDLHVELTSWSPRAGISRDTLTP